MRITILDLTTHPEPLLSGMPRVGEQIINWLQPAFNDARFTSISVAEDGETLPSIESFDGLLLSGSEYGVYDDTPWMKPLRSLLEQVRTAGKPIYGICFGHQIMADVFGGKAEKSSVGNVVGARQFEFLGKHIDAHVWHKDQVTKIPPSARVTASASHCPVGALSYDFPAESVQFHPEYKQSHLQKLFERGRGELLSHDDADAALESFKTTNVESHLMAKETAAFFRKNWVQQR